MEIRVTTVNLFHVEHRSREVRRSASRLLYLGYLAHRFKNKNGNKRANSKKTRQEIRRSLRTLLVDFARFGRNLGVVLHTHQKRAGFFFPATSRLCAHVGDLPLFPAIFHFTV